MSFDKPKHRATAVDQSQDDRPKPDNQRTVFLDELAATINKFPGLQARRLDPCGEMPMRVKVSLTATDVVEEIACDFSRNTGWRFVWLWNVKPPQLVGRAAEIHRSARAVATVMGIKMAGTP